MALELKYRPTSLEQVVGNEYIIKQLQANFNMPNPPKHTILLQGPRGCGKTTLARILANMAGCSHIKEMDVAAKGGKEEAVLLANTARTLSIFKGNKAYILDEVHMGTTAFFNALLKTLEEPPPHVFFFLCTTLPEKVLKTVRSRCAPYNVEKLSPPEIKTLLTHVLKQEQVTINSQALTRITRSCEGNPREALIMLDKIMRIDEADQVDAIQIINEQEYAVRELCQGLLKKQSWKTITSILRGLKNVSEETIRRAVLNYLNAILINGKEDDHIFLVMDLFKDPFYDSGRAGLTIACYDARLIDK